MCVKVPASDPFVAKGKSQVMINTDYKMNYRVISTGKDS